MIPPTIRSYRRHSAYKRVRHAPVRMPILSASELAPPGTLLPMQGGATAGLRRVTGRRNRMLALALWRRDDGLCGRCGLPIDPALDHRLPGALTIGHIVAHSAGGTYDPRNLQAEHSRCNKSGGNRTPLPIATVVRP